MTRRSRCRAISVREGPHTIYPTPALAGALTDLIGLTIISRCPSQTIRHNLDLSLDQTAIWRAPSTLVAMRKEGCNMEKKLSGTGRAGKGKSREGFTRYCDFWDRCSSFPFRARLSRSNHRLMNKQLIFTALRYVPMRPYLES